MPFLWFLFFWTFPFFTVFSSFVYFSDVCHFSLGGIIINYMLLPEIHTWITHEFVIKSIIAFVLYSFFLLLQNKWRLVDFSKLQKDKPRYNVVMLRKLTRVPHQWWIIDFDGCVICAWKLSAFQSNWIASRLIRNGQLISRS